MLSGIVMQQKTVREVGTSLFQCCMCAVRNVEFAVGPQLGTLPSLV